jgi:tripartite ATP-independent transporter DctM subunit
MLVSIGKLFGPIRGGLAIAIVIVGAILAASTGIVGASVVMMTVISLPIMLKYRYSPRLATGVIAASGTLGQLIPPSIVLIILGYMMNISVGDLFKSAVVPGLIVVTLYIAYILIYTLLNPEGAPPIPRDQPYREVLKEAVKSLIAPFLLIGLVLGSIFAGVATPTESAAVGVVGAIVLTLFYRTFSWGLLKYALRESVKITSMIFTILIGATAFSLVFNESGAGDMVTQFFTSHIASKWGFVAISMAIIFILGFFIDFIEISFIIIPILMPIAAHYQIDPLWFAILIAINLQTSFLTPPFGFSLFYLKGAGGDKVRTSDLYRGIIPFIFLQLLTLLLVVAFPKLVHLF